MQAILAVRQSEYMLDRSSCVFCGNHQTQLAFEARSQLGDCYKLVNCGACHTYSLTPHPSAAQLQAAYAEDYYGVGEAKFTAGIEGWIERFRRARARRVARLAPTGGRVLDVGCGNGRFLSYLIDLGYSCHGIELPGGSAERAKQVEGLQLKVGTLAAEDFAPASLDLVTLWHVYEHLPNPRQMLHMFAQMIKPGGYLVMSLPNIASWQARWFKGRWFHLDPPRHLFFQDSATIVKQLESIGFESVAFSSFSLEQNLFGFQQSLLNLCMSEREVLYELLKGNPGVRQRYSWLSRWGQIGFFLASAPVALLLALMEAGVGKGGTMELTFRRRQAGG